MIFPLLGPPVVLLVFLTLVGMVLISRNHPSVLDEESPSIVSSGRAAQTRGSA